MISYDATNHIQGISQGVGSAMPSLVAAGQKNAPGNPDLEAFINNSMEDYTRRRQSGEPAESIIGDYLQKMKSMQYPDATQSVHSVGAQGGAPSLGTPDMSAATNAPPNSFGGGSFNGLTPPSSAMGGGISGNVSQQPAISNAPIPNQTGGDAVYAPGGTNNMASEPKTVQVPMDAPATPGMQTTVRDSNPIPYEETPKDSIDLIKRDAGSSMQTGHGSPIPPMRTRAQQEQALGDIERMEKVGNANEGLDIKRMKLEQESQKAIMQNMRLTKKDIADLQTKIQGLDQKAQIAVVDMWLKTKAMEQKFTLGSERNKIASKKAGQAVPPAIKHLWDRYTNATGEIKSYMNSLDPNSPGKPERVKQLKKIAAKELHEYNMAAIEAGLPTRSDKDAGIPEVYGDNDPNNKVEDE